MSFISKLKQAFGFDTDDDLFDSDSGIVSDDDDIQVHGSDSQERTAVVVDMPDAPAVSSEMKARIFEGVVAVFNSALPEFLAKSVNPQEQQRILADSIDKSVDRYLDELLLQANTYAEARLKASVEASKRDADLLRSEMQQLEQQRSSIREQQLSADRRRRALADRVTDLEAQVERVEAEREQFELENKSLLNKLKVADIQPGIVDDMSKTIEDLKAQLAEAKGGDAAESVAKEYELKIEAVRTEEAAKQTALLQTIEDLKQQAEMGQVMYNDLQGQYATEKEARSAAETELAQARGLLDEVKTMQAQFVQIEKMIAKRDARIEKLKTDNKHLRDELAMLKDQLAAAESPNLFGYGEAADAADDRAEKVLDSVATEIATIEDDFECPDWFVAEPAADVVPLRAEDTPFGYTEPPKKPRKPDSDAQLSLF